VARSAGLADQWFLAENLRANLNGNDHFPTAPTGATALDVFDAASAASALVAIGSRGRRIEFPGEIGQESRASVRFERPSGPNEPAEGFVGES